MSTPMLTGLLSRSITMSREKSPRERSAYRCLLLALDAHQRTGGLFDITLGSRIAQRKAGAAGPETPLAGQLIIHPDVPAITCDIPGRELDLGGIAKGFALDQLQILLDEWDAPDYLLTAGGSSLWVKILYPTTPAAIETNSSSTERAIILNCILVNDFSESIRFPISII